MRVTRIAGSECLEIAPAFSVKPEGTGRMSEGSFRGDRFFLSNFYEAALEYGGITYGSSEAAYQAQKCSSEGIGGSFPASLPPRRRSSAVSWSRAWAGIRRRPT